MTRPVRMILPATLVAVALVGAVAIGADIDRGAFVQRYCADCHRGPEPAGRLDLTALAGSLDDRGAFDRWVRVHDKVRDAKMPPADADQPPADERQAFVAALAESLTAADRARQAAQGRGVVRRMNRLEYETALVDLFQMPLQIQQQLPEDARGAGFDTVGAALNVSSVQMESYLAALDQVLDRATALYERPERRTWRLSYKETRGMMEEYRPTNAFSVEADGVALLGPDYHSYLNSLLDHFVIPYSARYRVRVSAYAIRSEAPIAFTIRTGGPGHAEREDVPRTLLGHVLVQAGAPQVFEFDVNLERGQFFRMYPARLPVIRFDSAELRGTQNKYTGPGVLVQWIEVDGPIFDAWPPAAHELLWGGVPLEPLADAKPNDNPNEHLLHPPTDEAQPRMTSVPKKKYNPATGVRRYYDPNQGVGGEPIYRRARIPDPLRPVFRLAPRDPEADAARLLRRFVAAVYRRPTSDADADPFVRLAARWLNEGVDFETALRAAYRAVLTSPEFLYHQASFPPPAGESPQLDDHALAERLAFFLWNGPPDAELRRLANAGTLGDPDTLRAQTDRMLADARAQRFLRSFLGQWLDLRLLEFTTPDSALYPEHDAVLQWSIEAETVAFFNELLRDDLSVRNVVDSDFAMLNCRLAEHYGIEGVEGMELRRVSLPAESVRGGVLTQASVLKVTANGTNTSPVVRGVWVADRILGQPSDPPPPGVPAIEPDIRGAVTVRQQLERHRSVASCATCHARIDPPGVALENFDVIGSWREHYRVLDPEKADLKTIGHPGMKIPVKYQVGLPVDAADRLPDGRAFRDIREFKRLLLDDPDQIARTVTEKLLTYATGAPLSFADRGEVDRLVDQTRPRDHGFRTLLHAVVQSPAFRMR